jgi:hypothetical protein
MSTCEGELKISSEFATVILSVDRRGNGDRLAIRDMESGATIELDALELASLCKLSHHDFDAIVKPE